MLLMPSEVNGIQQLVRDLNHISMSKIVSSLEENEMLITVPKFKIDYNTDLLSKLEDVSVCNYFYLFSCN
jgi:Serpin (serine protease inhibitor).